MSPATAPGRTASIARASASTAARCRLRAPGDGSPIANVDAGVAPVAVPPRDEVAEDEVTICEHRSPGAPPTSAVRGPATRSASTGCAHLPRPRLLPARAPRAPAPSCPAVLLPRRPLAGVAEGERRPKQVYLVVVLDGPGLSKRGAGLDRSQPGGQRHRQRRSLAREGRAVCEAGERASRTADGIDRAEPEARVGDELARERLSLPRPRPR